VANYTQGPRAMKTYTYKLKPSPRLERVFESWLERCRELYNAALAEQREAYRTAKTTITYTAQAAQLPAIKAVREDVAALNAQVLQDVLRRLDNAFAAFFRRVKAGQRPGYPRFRGRGRYKSFTFPQAKGAFRLSGRHLYLSKIGRVKLFLSRPMEGTIKTCMIKREADGWYVLFAVDEDRSPYYPKTGETAGADLGIEHFLTLSNGEGVPNPRHLERAEAALKRAQQAVSRKQKGGSNRTRARAQLARKHQRVQRSRADFHHKTSLALIRRFDAMVFEDLNIAGMLKNHHLAKAIASVAWNAFLVIHFAKASSAGRGAMRVPAAFTSQACSGCGARVRKTLSERIHICIACGLRLTRDHNAALNVKARAGPVGMGEGARENHAPPPL
jgi:putative transposase